MEEAPTPAPTLPQPEQPAIEKPKLIFSQATQARAKAHARKLIEKNDSNGDGKLDFEELPHLVRGQFKNYDVDQDGFASVKEIETAAKFAYHNLEIRANKR